MALSELDQLDLPTRRPPYNFSADVPKRVVASRTVCALAAAGGLGAWLMPLAGASFFLPSIFVGLALSLALHQGEIGRLWAPLAGAWFLAGLGGLIPLSLLAALLGASLLMLRRSHCGCGLALLIVALQLSYVPTVEALISGALAPLGNEAASPAATAFLGLAFIAWRSPVPLILGLGATLLIAYFARLAGFVPELELAASALPAMSTAAYLGAGNLRTSTSWAAVLIFFLALSWTITPPRLALPHHVSLVLPADQNAPEAPHFRGLAAALRHAGIVVNERDDINEIGAGEYVLLPWISTPLRANEDEFSAEFRRLANERRWTVLIFGEHDGMGEADRRAAQLAQRPMFHRDLTVPPGNGDTSGPAHAADLRAWPHWAILNRGASTNPHDARARILLASDGWWSDPDIGEWLWTGDYRWRPGDRGGRLTLAHAVGDLHGATWVAIGDTSPILTRQLIADPRPLLRLLYLSSLLPAALRDTTLIASGLWLALTIRRRVSAPTFGIAGSAATLAFAAAIIGFWLPMRHEQGPWRSHYVGEGGFEPTNFAAGLAHEPGLLDSGWTLVRQSRPVSGALSAPPKPTISFVTINDEATAGGVRFSRCWRLGALDIGGNGPRLVDAQACAIEGDAEILVGDRTAAAILRINRPSGPWILVLDRGFLSESAPASNASWLLRTVQNASPS